MLNANATLRNSSMATPSNQGAVRSPRPPHPALPFGQAVDSGLFKHGRGHSVRDLQSGDLVFSLVVKLQFGTCLRAAIPVSSQRWEEEGWWQQVFRHGFRVQEAKPPSLVQRHLRISTKQHHG